MAALIGLPYLLYRCAICCMSDYLNEYEKKDFSGISRCVGCEFANL